MVDTERQRDELVERLFAASLGSGELLTVYLGDTLGLLPDPRPGRPDVVRGAGEGGGDVRAAHAGVAGAAGRGRDPRRRRRVGRRRRTPVRPASGSRRAAPGPRQPVLDGAGVQVVRRRVERHARARRRLPIGGGGSVELLRPRHDRGAGRLQPAVARRLPRHRVPALDPGHPRAAPRNRARRSPTSRAGSAGPPSRSPRRIRTSPSTGSTSTSSRSRSPPGTRRRPGSRIACGSRRRTPRIPRWRADTTSRWWWRRSTTCPSRSRSWARSENMLKPGGTLIVADERTEDAFTAPASETERFFYAYSVLCCLPSAMDDDTSAATGTVMRRSTFERYAKEAGFDERIRPADRARLPSLLPARPLASGAQAPEASINQSTR